MTEKETVSWCHRNRKLFLNSFGRLKFCDIRQRMSETKLAQETNKDLFSVVDWVKTLLVTDLYHSLMNIAGF